MAHHRRRSVVFMNDIVLLNAAQRIVDDPASEHMTPLLRTLRVLQQCPELARLADMNADQVADWRAVCCLALLSTPSSGQNGGLPQPRMARADLRQERRRAARG